MENIRAIEQILIANQILRDTKCHHEHLLGIYLVIDKDVDVISDNAPVYQIIEQSDQYIWSNCIQRFGVTKCCHEHHLGVYLVIDKFVDVHFDKSPQHQMLDT